MTQKASQIKPLVIFKSTWLKLRKSAINIDLEKVKKVLLVFYAVLFISTVYHFVYAKRIIPGVRIAGVKVGGMTFNQAKKVLQNHESQVNKELKLKYEDEEFILRGEEVGLLYDWDATVSRAFEVGRTGNIITDGKDKVAGLFKSLYIKASYDYDDSALGVKFSIIKGEINKDVVPAGVVLTDGNLVVTASQSGKKVVDDGLYSIVAGSFDKMDFSDKNIPTKIINPPIVEKDVTLLLSDVEKIISQDLTIAYGDNKWVLGKQDLLNLLSFEKSDNGKVKIVLNESKLSALTDNVSKVVNVLPRGKVTAVADGTRVLSFGITREGQELDVSRFENDFKNSLFGNRTKVSLYTNVVSGSTDKDKYGIYALLGEGTSHYAHSIPNRIHNLTLAAERTNGVLVAPGAVYSMNDSVGDISAKTGYYPAYVIAGNRTVLGDGGGVCQTSTTLFRAVLNAGLPIVMRYAHAYRVGYYEQDMPVGFDATIFQPSWDFKFKNDTAGYVLVQSFANLDDLSLTFRLYGTPDGRKVEISKPSITNQIAPPEPLYQDDPTLPKGVVTQVEFPAWGASVVFTRTVKKGNDVMFTDTFSSRYQPWRAVFLVGTKK